jgi:hypothetical protein
VEQRPQEQQEQHLMRVLLPMSPDLVMPWQWMLPAALLPLLVLPAPVLLQQPVMQLSSL